MYWHLLLYRYLPGILNLDIYDLWFWKFSSVNFGLFLPNYGPCYFLMFIFSQILSILCVCVCVCVCVSVFLLVSLKIFPLEPYLSTFWILFLKNSSIISSKYISIFMSDLKSIQSYFP